MRVPRLLQSALVLPCLLAAPGAWGQTDSAAVQIDSTVLLSYRRSSAVLSAPGGLTRVDLAGIASIPSVFGNADPLRFLNALPGVETGNEFDAGLHIQGSESSHSIVLMEGVPVYGAKHLLGLFSVFNPSHFESMHYQTTASGCNRLGGEVDMRLPGRIPDRTGIDFSSGLASSQASMRQPFGASSVLSVSLRRSLLDLLFPGKIRVEDDPVDYRFYDFDLSLQSYIGPGDVLTLNLYGGSDALGYSSASDFLNLDMRWRNALASAAWTHGKLEQQLFYSGYALAMDLGYNSLSVSVPSGISTAGYKASWQDRGWKMSLETLHHRAALQCPEIEGSSYGRNVEQEIQGAQESTLFASYGFEPWPGLLLSLSASGIHYFDPEHKSHWAVSPAVDMTMNLYQAGKLDLKMGSGTQFLFQTGVTNLGFPCEFWFLAGKHSDPQSSLYATLSYGLEFARGMFSFKAETYYRQLYNQIEYKGDVLDFINSEYSLDASLLKGGGRNFGFNLLLHKQAGRLTAWAGYSFGRALRSFDVPGYAGEYPSNHERLHELNAVLNWTAPKWSAGASMVAASGTPFTAPDSFYILGGRVVSHYGPHNADRLSAYMRLDLSFNYYFTRTASRSCGMNISVYNATMRENQLFCRLSAKDGRFAYRPFALGFSVLPSIGFFCRI